MSDNVSVRSEGHVDGPAGVALVAATAVHAGFQAVVTLQVYPAFREVPQESWPHFHTAHSRRIAGIVVVVYGSLVAVSAWVLVAGPRNAGTLAAIGFAALAMLTTAAVAAPAHGRLSGGRGDRELARLLRADRVRFVAGVLAAGAAVVGVVPGVT
ncbi:MAG TPA: hypothetical protein VK964_18615 [Nocardioidaceae bacterium]|nr:hypothetical protein [Nocardioidaceae bacterium]